MIIGVAVLIAVLCVLASARRLWFATNPTGFHPDDVVERLKAGATLEDLQKVAARQPSTDWERDLFEALLEKRPEARAALVNEQLTELDHRLQRWARVPRVCASVATSAGIMLGTLVLRNGLASAPDLSGELGELFVRDILNQAISVASFGIIGTAFCIAAHSHAGRLTRGRLKSADQMIEKLEVLAQKEVSFREDVVKLAEPGTS